MRKSYVWDDVRRVIEVDDRNKNDHNVSRYDVRMEDGRVTFHQRAYEMSDHAFGQMCGRTKIPGTYAGVVRARNLSLFDDMMNDGLAHVSGDGRHLFRVRENPQGTASNGLLRAALSGDYSVFNNTDVVNILGNIFSDPDWEGRHQIRDFVHNEFGVWMKVLFDDLRTWDPVHKDTELKVGAVIGNSEVGTRNVVLRPFVYRYACTNDLIYKRDYALEQRHVHLDKREMVRRFNYALSKCIEDGSNLLDVFSRAANVGVANPLKTLERVLQQGKFTKNEIDTAKAKFLMEPHNTRFGIVNAMTAAAREFDSERRIEVEAFAGDYLMAA